MFVGEDEGSAVGFKVVGYGAGASVGGGVGGVVGERVGRGVGSFAASTWR